MEPSCRAVAALRLDCWDAPPPPICGDGTCTPGESCPADCAPPPSGVSVAFRVLGCSDGTWTVETRFEGSTGEAIVAAPGSMTWEYDGFGVLLELPACLVERCPAAEILGHVRAIEGVCQ
jgi:hypothetical protein